MQALRVAGFALAILSQSALSSPIANDDIALLQSPSSHISRSSSKVEGGQLQIVESHNKEGNREEPDVDKEPLTTANVTKSAVEPHAGNDKVVEISVPSATGNSSTILRITNPEEITARTVGSSDGGIISAQASDNDTLESNLVGPKPKIVYDEITDEDVSRLSIQEDRVVEDDAIVDGELEKSSRAMSKAAEISSRLEKATAKASAAEKGVKALEASKIAAEKQLEMMANSSDSVTATVEEAAQLAQQALKDGKALQEKAEESFQAQTERKELSDKLASQMQDAIASASEALKEVALSSGVAVNMTEVSDAVVAAPEEAEEAAARALAAAKERLSSTKSAADANETVLDSDSINSALKVKTQNKLYLPDGSRVEAGSIIVIDNPAKISRTWDPVKNESIITIVDPRSISVGENVSGNITPIPATSINDSFAADVSLVAGSGGPQQESELEVNNLTAIMQAGENSLREAEDLMSFIKDAEIDVQKAASAVHSAKLHKNSLVLRLQQAINATEQLGDDLSSAINQNSSTRVSTANDSSQVLNASSVPIVVDGAIGVENYAIEVRRLAGLIKEADQALRANLSYLHESRSKLQKLAVSAESQIEVAMKSSARGLAIAAEGGSKANLTEVVSESVGSGIVGNKTRAAESDDELLDRDLTTIDTDKDLTTIDTDKENYLSAKSSKSVTSTGDSADTKEQSNADADGNSSWLVRTLLVTVVVVLVMLLTILCWPFGPIC